MDSTKQRETRYHGSWPYVQYEYGDRVFLNGRPYRRGTVVIPPDDDGITYVRLDGEPRRYSDPIGAWNVKPVDITITEDPV